MSETRVAVIAGDGIGPEVIGSGAIWAASLLLEHAGHENAGRCVLAALEETLADGAKTPDFGGGATTEEVVAAVIERLADAPGA